MAIRYTEKELNDLGFVEVAPGQWQRRNPEKISKPAKKVPEQFSNLHQDTLTIGGKTHRYRSGWEADYAKYLEFLKRTNQIKEWEYEPKRFVFEKIKSGCTSYLPDFLVTENDESYYWVEVKGYLDQKGATKLNRMKKYFPNEVVKLVRKEEIMAIKKSGVLEYKL